MSITSTKYALKEIESIIGFNHLSGDAPRVRELADKIFDAKQLL